MLQLIFGGSTNIIYMLLLINVYYFGSYYMDYITVKEAAKRWNLSERRIQTMCNDGIIEGVIKFGHAWAIPGYASRPIDNRIKSGKYVKEKQSPD